MMNPILDPTRRRRATAAAAAALLALAATTARADQFANVSQLVTGLYQSTPLILVNTPTYACGASCVYDVMTTVGATTDLTPLPGPFTASVWPLLYGASLTGIASEEEALAVPAPPSGYEHDGGSIGALRRAKVQFDALMVFNGKHEMSVQTWKDGSGAAVVSVSIRLTPAATKHHYLEFAVPKSTRSWQEAWYMGGPSGNQNFYTLPKQMQSRTAVDVYVDGLPVWSGSSHKLKPQRWSPPSTSYLDVKWGAELVDDDVKLYLGSLPAGATRTISVVMRTDLRVNADCHNDTDSYGGKFQRCDSRREALSLPATLVSSGSGPYSYVNYKPNVRVVTL